MGCSLSVAVDHVLWQAHLKYTDVRSINNKFSPYIYCDSEEHLLQSEAKK